MTSHHEEIRDEPRGWGHMPNAPDSRSALEMTRQLSPETSRARSNASLLPDPASYLANAWSFVRFESPGQEDPLEKGMATHSRILAWRIP